MHIIALFFELVSQCTQTQFLDLQMYIKRHIMFGLRPHLRLFITFSSYMSVPFAMEFHTKNVYFLLLMIDYFFILQVCRVFILS